MPLCSGLAEILCTPLLGRYTAAGKMGSLFALAVAEEEKEDDPNDTKASPSCIGGNIS